VRKTLTVAFAVAGILVAASNAGAASDSDPRPSDAALSASSDKSADEDARLQVGRPLVEVRVYDTAVVPAADQTVALRAATGVLAAAGIDVSWLVCGRDVSAQPTPCDARLGPAEMAVRLVRLGGTPSPRGRLSLGYSLVDMAVAGGTLATVYVDRVEWLASRIDGCESALVLGFALAHEIGHLLLGTNTHAEAGLLRAVWSRTDLQRKDPADWHFTGAESVAIRRAIRQRQVQMATNIRTK
jgi:hypothetical protein